MGRRTKMTEENVFVRQPDGSVSVVSIHNLVAAYAGEDSEFAGLEFINIHNGRQMFFGPIQSVPGNEFSGLYIMSAQAEAQTLSLLPKNPMGVTRYCCFKTVRLRTNPELKFCKFRVVSRSKCLEPLTKFITPLQLLKATLRCSAANTGSP